MSSTSATNPRPSANAGTQPIKRRGLLAALGVLLAGVVGKITETPLSAGTDGDVVLGGPTTTTTTTSITKAGLGETLSLSGVSGTTLSAVNTNRHFPTFGIFGQGGYGVYGIT